MKGLLFEGVESLRLPCSWVLLIPALAVTIYGRRRTPLVMSIFVSVAILVAWLRFAGWWFEVPRGAVQVILGLVLMAGAAIAWKCDTGVGDAIIAALSGMAAVWAWTPCVGPHLADVLNNASREPFAHFGGTAAFIFGLLLPFVLVASIGVVLPAVQQKLSHHRVITVGAVLIGMVGLLFVTTLFDNLASALFRISEF